MAYYIDYDLGVLVYCNGTLEDAKKLADQNATQTKKNIYLLNENKNVILSRTWHSTKYDPSTNPYDVRNILLFPNHNIGYYAPWQRKVMEEIEIEEEPYKSYDPETDTLYVKALAANYDRFCEENHTHFVKTMRSRQYGTDIFVAEPDDDEFDSYCFGIAEHLYSTGWTVEEQDVWMERYHIYGFTARVIAEALQEIRARRIHDAIFAWANMWEDDLLDPPTEVKSPDETIYGDVSSTITCDGGVYRWVLTRDGELYKAWYKASPTDKNIYRLDCHNARLIEKIIINPEYDGSRKFDLLQDTI